MGDPGQSETVLLYLPRLKEILRRYGVPSRVQGFLILTAEADWKPPDWAPIDIKALAREVRCHPRSIERALAALEKAGIFERQYPNKQDRGGIRLSPDLPGGTQNV